MSDQNNLPKKENKGFLFVNQNKNKPAQPDHTGRILIEGKEYRLSGWESVSQDGKKYLSLAVTPYFPPSNNQSSSSGNKQVSNNSNRQATPAAPIMNDFDFDIDDILNSSED